MNRTEPPRFATWILEHFMPTEGNEALDGDLIESFRAGRSAGWYWHQVCAATALRLIRSLFRHRFVLIFAAAWAMLSPAWFLMLIRFWNRNNFGGGVWRFPWPWSTICDFGLSTVMVFLFLWAGALLYVIFRVSMFAPVSLRRIRRGFAMSIVGYFAAWVCEFALLSIIYPYFSGHAFGLALDWRTLTLPDVVVSFGILTTVIRLPYLVGTASALWGAVPEAESSVRHAEENS